MTYKEMLLKDVDKYKCQGFALIVTATSIETYATHSKLNPFPDQKSLIKTYHGSLTYYWGLYGNYCVAHVECGMGSSSRDASIMTISEAISELAPNFVIMIGIAFGIDKKTQNIGDVLVSECVCPYNSVRVGTDETTPRSIYGPASKILVSRFKSLMYTWEYLLHNNNRAKLIIAHVLSGEELIDNIERRDELHKLFPTAKGGEMEGAGLFAACDGKVDWIIVKGICDFADGKKGFGKDTKQNIAIDSALSLCLELFSSVNGFDELGMRCFIKPDENNGILHKLYTQNSLFDFYEIDKEPYYIQRKTDSDFVDSLSFFSIWLHGTSGSGKTSLVIRNLVTNCICNIQIYLASCYGLNNKEIFDEILFELELRVIGKSDRKHPSNFKGTSTKIIEVLSTLANKKVVIFVDELPISDEAEFNGFVEMMSSILILKSTTYGLSNVKFVFSSINNPLLGIKTYQLKIHEQLKFIEFDNWSEGDIITLINIISDNIGLIMSSDVNEKLIKESQRSPRFIKIFFRNLIACNAVIEKDQIELLNETKRELR